MSGGVGDSDCNSAGYAELEVAGQDLGIDPESHAGDPAGFVDNFELPNLLIGPAAHVSLVDNMDNGNRDGPFGVSEALYVDTLTFTDVEGRLNLNQLHLYYNNLNGSEGQIIHDNNGNGIPDECECPADFDGSSDVNAADLAELLSSWGPCVGCPADFDGDDVVDSADLAELLAAWGPCE